MLHEIKGKLAKLLATENLIIEHRDVSTAQFDVARRVLTLPLWKIKSEDVYDLLVAHEVGHALFTDPRSWELEEEWKKTPKAFVNITEDVRIEKLMKRRYAGLNKTFNRGYSDLDEQDFFETKGEDLSTFSFPDRINLYYKIGAYLNIKFSSKEKEIVDLIGRTESFNDALAAARTLAEYIQSQQDTDQEAKASNMEGSIDQIDLNQLLDDLDPSEEESDKELDEDLELDSDDIDTDHENYDSDLDVPSYEKGNEGGNHANDFETKTVESLEEKLQELAGKYHDGQEPPVYLSLPEIDLDRSVIPVGEIHSYVEKEWAAFAENIDKMYGDDSYFRTWWDESDTAFTDFKKSTAKEVNYLVKEFEMKKSASAYARAATAKTGVLDTLKLHQYKYNDDIFKKITVLPDGKNHGLVFVLDWSGSMADVLLNTVKQMYNLIWFSRKVGIPYEVYAFTNEWYHYGIENIPDKKDQREDEIYLGAEFSLMNLLSSKTNSKESDRQMKNIWRIAHSFTSRMGGAPRRLGLSGTPLNESLLCLHKLIPDFQKKTGVEKVNVCILTDGEASPLARTASVKRHWEEHAEVRHKSIRSNCFLRHNGYTRRLSDVYFKFTKVLLDDLKTSFPQVNFVGFRLLGNRDLSHMISRYITDFEDRDRARADWRKHKSFTIKKQGYDSFFVLSSTNLANDTEFEVKEDATKAQIRSAFKKSLNSKKMNKKVLSEFVDMVA